MTKKQVQSKIMRLTVVVVALNYQMRTAKVNAQEEVLP